MDQTRLGGCGSTHVGGGEKNSRRPETYLTWWQRCLNLSQRTSWMDFWGKFKVLSNKTLSNLAKPPWTTSHLLRARRALTLYKDLPLRTRRALLLFKVYVNSALHGSQWREELEEHCIKNLRTRSGNALSNSMSTAYFLVLNGTKLN